MRLVLLVAFAATSALAQDTTALIDRAANQYRSARTVHATFEQTMTSEATGNTHPARGEYFQSGGKKFALRFTDPSGDAVVSDGTTLWMYLPSSVKGQVIKMPAEVGQGLDVLSSLLSSPHTNYTIVHGKDETVDGHAATVYTLTPKRAGLPFEKATLWIGKTDALIWQLDAVEQSTLVRHVRFKTVEMNSELPTGALTFIVPAGARVIDQESLMGRNRKP